MNRLTRVTGVAVAAMFCGLCIAGCAVGRNELTGEVVLGFGAGRLVETANQGLSAVGDMLIPGAGAALAAVGLPVFGWARSAAARAAAEAKREGERKGWDEAAVAHSPALPPARAATEPAIASGPVAGSGTAPAVGVAPAPSPAV